jgi:hypothetical protein
MGEKVDNWQEWTGSGLVGVAITGYLYSQYASTHYSDSADSVAGAPETVALLPDGSVGTAAFERTTTGPVPVTRQQIAVLDEAVVAATPGSLPPSFSFRRALRPAAYNMPNVQDV